MDGQHMKMHLDDGTNNNNEYLQITRGDEKRIYGFFQNENYVTKT